VADRSTVRVNGAVLSYAERGEGAALVLLHGGLVSSAMWEPLVPEITGDLRVITPDSRGHGHSTNPDGELSYPALADDVAGLIGALGLVRPVVGGWSDGGQVALELAVRHPGSAGALIVGAAHPDFAASGLREAHRALLGADETGAPDLARLDEHLGEVAGAIKAWHPGGTDRWRALVEQTAPMWLGYAGLTTERLASIDVPVLVLTGDRDELVPLDLALSLYLALPDAELAVCPRAGHGGPMTPERAPAFAAMISDFARRYAAG